jgi:hypothetical protein
MAFGFEPCAGGARTGLRNSTMQRAPGFLEAAPLTTLWRHDKLPPGPLRGDGTIHL